MQPGHLLHSCWISLPTKSESEPKEKNIFKIEEKPTRIVQFEFFSFFICMKFLSIIGNMCQHLEVRKLNSCTKKDYVCSVKADEKVKLPFFLLIFADIRTTIMWEKKKRKFIRVVNHHL